MEKIIGRYKIKVLQDTDAESPRTAMDNLGTMVCFHNRYDLGDKHDYRSSDYSGWEEMLKAIDKREDACIILPLFLLDHSGITMSTKDFNDRWDSGQVGFIFVSKKKVREEYSVKRITKALAEKICTYLEGEVETYDQFLTGDVYGYQIWKLGKKSGKEKKEIDSCWGFYGEDACMKEAEACVPEQVLPEVVE